MNKFIIPTVHVMYRFEWFVNGFLFVKLTWVIETVLKLEIRILSSASDFFQICLFFIKNAEICDVTWSQLYVAFKGRLRVFIYGIFVFIFCFIENHQKYSRNAKHVRNLATFVILVTLNLSWGEFVNKSASKKFESRTFRGG